MEIQKNGNEKIECVLGNSVFLIQKFEITPQNHSNLLYKRTIFGN